MRCRLEKGSKEKKKGEARRTMGNYHISVCVCTYKRQGELLQLLKALDEQETRELFTYSISIVDNDVKRSAEKVVSGFKGKSNVDTFYYIEPVRNISLARNMAVRYASGNLIAFIDDDERPEKTWLMNLFNAYIKYKAAGVLGPVMPEFIETPPEWVEAGGFFERKIYHSGKTAEWEDCRTGNLLLNKDTLKGDSLFDKRYGLTGGEDTDFFKRMMEKGHSFVWCDNARAYERIPVKRATFNWLLKRELRRGSIFASIKLNNTNVLYRIYFLARALFTCVLFAIFVPFSILGGVTSSISCIFRTAWNIGKLLGGFGITVKGYRF